MPGSSNTDATPLVSIILPTFNRSGFLDEALHSIRRQKLTDWELIAVDDGSTDGTRSVIERWSREIPQRVRYEWQENQGPDVARNRGIDLSRGRYVAFFDSDDLWLPHHLSNCVDQLEQNADIDWVFAASQGIDVATGTIVWESSMRDGQQLRPFLQVHTERRGNLCVLSDPRCIEVAIANEFCAGPQISVMRRRIFESLRLPEFRIGPDQTFVAIALSHGFRMAYLESVHVVYRCHGDNLSLSTPKSVDSRLQLMREFTGAFEALRQQIPLTRAQRRALNHRLSREYFWNVGYPLVQGRHFDPGILYLWRGLRLRPLKIELWKTFLVSLVRKQWCRLTAGASRQTSLSGISRAP